MYKNQFTIYKEKNIMKPNLWEFKKKDKKKISNENTSHLSCIS